jgi:hypothetical protein
VGVPKKRRKKAWYALHFLVANLERAKQENFLEQAFLCHASHKTSSGGDQHSDANP